MRARIVALHGFLGCGADWDAVRAASRCGAPWVCPDLFAPGATAWNAPGEGTAWLVGYSFGARLALRWLRAEPERWHGAVLISANPGNFQTATERAVRRAADAQWATTFRTKPWADVIRAWNAQQVFGGHPGHVRNEQDYDRARLIEALETSTVADQFTEASRLPARLVWLAGAKDEKFAALLESMRHEGFPGKFYAVPGAGHRLLSEAPNAVAAALDELVLSA